jgi:hypothetical protein
VRGRPLTITDSTIHDLGSPVCDRTHKIAVAEGKLLLHLGIYVTARGASTRQLTSCVNPLVQGREAQVWIESPG